MKSNYFHVVAARHVKDYVLEITFSDDHVSRVDFKKAFDYYCKGYYAKYKKPTEFKKFKIDEGHLVWGKDWDIIFQDQYLYEGHIPVPEKQRAAEWYQ